jgi:hypothetical protein
MVAGGGGGENRHQIDHRKRTYIHEKSKTASERIQRGFKRRLVLLDIWVMNIKRGALQTKCEGLYFFAHSHYFLFQPLLSNRSVNSSISEINVCRVKDSV